MIPEATFPGGIALAPSEQWEIDYVEEHYREGERRERDAEDAPPTRVEDFEKCWTARAEGGDIIGFLGILVMPNESCMSRTRSFCFMSCENANRHKLAFVKASRPVFRFAAEQCPPWVGRFLSWPLESYAASVRWQERAIGMRRVARIPAPKAGEWYIVLELTRKEVESWERG
jgi:hypothetical protein